MTRRKKWIIFLAAVALSAAGAAVYCLAIVPHLQPRLVDRLIADFKAGPCQATAEPLLEMLVGRKVSTHKGAEIAGLLFEPKVTQAGPCHPGEPFVLDVAPKRAIRALCVILVKHTLSVEGSETVRMHYGPLLENVRLAGPFVRGVALGRVPPATLPVPPALVMSRPGTYKGVLTLECILFCPGSYAHFQVTTWQAVKVWLRSKWPLLLPEPTASELLSAYTCTFEVPVRIHVVPATQPATKPDRG